MLPAQPNRSLMDGIACLQALVSSERPLGTRELARLLGLEPTRVNRLLRTLAAMRLAEQVEGRKYRPGTGIHVLAAQSLHGSGLIDRALRHLRGLHDFGHAVALGVLWRDQVSYLYHVGTRDPEAHMLQGTSWPAASSGLGIALLAHEPDEQVREVYAPTDDSLFQLSSPRPPLDGADGLLATLRRTREQGYALIGTEPGMSTVAVTIGHPPYAALGISGALTDDEVPALLAALRSAAKEIDGGAERNGGQP
ncbi:IclR family transcriptional regulator [Streptomyces sp. NBRC 109706]|uniref:IclR family transcriptional regulator n=1 Tax=Streptomyces sp. NBRC 109706 TaxID=1550035 RepID=UPI0018FEAEEB|nr:IclR family transcriptional regulator C-terminal domain-containing protein [Streptomyces sp. NBRC 109706]